MFADRIDAGERLARVLDELPPDALVLGIPRGGVVVARAVARRLGLELDVILARKLGAPGNPELAIGAVGPDGAVVLDAEVVATFSSLPEEYVRTEAAHQLVELRRRLVLYRGERAPPDVRARTTVVIDDGIATGSTARAALRWVRRSGASAVVLAVPVAPAPSVDALAPLADRVVCLETPERFYAVGQWYARFGEVSDDEVIAALRC